MSWVATERIPPAPPPVAADGWGARLRRLFIGSPVSGATTVVLVLAIVPLAGWLLS